MDSFSFFFFVFFVYFAVYCTLLVSNCRKLTFFIFCSVFFLFFLFSNIITISNIMVNQFGKPFPSLGSCCSFCCCAAYYCLKVNSVCDFPGILVFCFFCFFIQFYQSKSFGLILIVSFWYFSFLFFIFCCFYCFFFRFLGNILFLCCPFDWCIVFKSTINMSVPSNFLLWSLHVCCMNVCLSEERISAMSAKSNACDCFVSHFFFFVCSFVSLCLEI